MRKFLILQGIYVSATMLAFIMLATGARFVQMETRSPVKGGGHCAAPCWQGIRPGETLIERANRIMLSQGYSPEEAGSLIIYTRPEGVQDCITSFQRREEVVQETRLSNCPDLQLGDMIVALGLPDWVAPNLIVFELEGGVARVRLQLPKCGEHLSPHHAVQDISLARATTSTQEPVMARWQGFAPPRICAFRANCDGPCVLNERMTVLSHQPVN